MSDTVRIWSYEHGAWWGEGRWGYSTDPRQAGEYARDEAEKIVSDANRHLRTFEIRQEIIVDYTAILDTIENDRRTSDVPEGVLILLGFEGRYEDGRFKCRKAGANDKTFRPCPLLTASSAEAYLTGPDAPGHFDDIAFTFDPVEPYYSVSYTGPYGNDYGNSASIGRAMWAAFVRSMGAVHDDED